MDVAHPRRIASVVLLAIVLLLLGGGSIDANEPHTVFLPIVQRQGECAIPDPLPLQEVRIVPVEGDGIQMRVTSSCSPARHVMMRVYYIGNQCPTGCYTGRVFWDFPFQWIGLPKIQSWPGVYRDNQFVEFWSGRYLPYTVDVLPLPPGETIFELHID